MAEWFTLGVLLIVFIFTIYLLKKYPAKNISYIVYISVFYGWFSSLVIITLIPYDIYLSLGGSGNKVILTYSWYFVYWSIFGLCWVIFPVMLAFHNSGDFTFFLRLKRAIYKETKFFLLEFGIALCFVIYLYFLEHLQFIQIPQILILMSSIWGLFLIVLMLGYGLVAVPLSTWKSANLKKKLSILQTRAVPVADAKTNNLHELKQVSSRIVQMNSAVSEGSPLKKYSEMLLVYCVTHNWSLISPSSVKNVEYKDLVKLHEDAKKLTIEKERLESLWEVITTQVFHIEDLLAAKTSRNFCIKSALWPEIRGKYKQKLEFLQYFYYIHLLPLLSRYFAVVFALLSSLILLGESTLYVSTPSNLLPFLFIHNYGEIGTQVLCMIPLTYIIFCLYFSMFQLKAQGKYGMYKKHTQNASLIYSACFMSRIIPVICYNFLLLFKVENSEYSNVIDSLDIIPYLGEEYSRYLPILIGVVCISNVFNVYNRFMKAVGLENFTFEEVLNKKNKIQGKALLAKARTEKEREVRQKKNLSHVKSISVIDDFEESFSISASLQ